MKRAVEALAKKDLKFLQPMYEAITNSLESGSSTIIIDIQTEDLAFSDIKPKITGFSITDDGAGFTQKNIESFLELWSDAKYELGCKGSGRFTWLNVFNKIIIESEVSTENKKVIIPFNLTFKDEDILYESITCNKNKTVITFTDITEKYYNSITNLDNRDLADIDTIKNNIEKVLLLKLFLLKRNGNKFSIVINIGGQQRIISEKTIPELSVETFNIYSEITKEDYSFALYYHFIEDRKNSKKIYYCANNRTVKEEDDDDLNFSCELPNKTSFNMLLCSNYLDDMVNDSRNDFPAMSNKRQANIGCPLLFKDIKPKLLNQMHLILLKKFPELEQLNKEQEEKAINSSPYLTKYIKEVDDIVKTEKSLTVKALDSFNKSKIKIKTKFEKLLKDKSIDPKEFDKAVTEISEVAAAELGEYILYRNSLIAALNDAISDFDKKEKYIHDIFMPMKTVSDSSDKSKHIISNLWLLDDRYMTYSLAASDKSIRELKEKLNINNPSRFKDLNRPDLLIYFKNESENKDVVIVELKGANADKDEKKKALTELPDNISLVRQHFNLKETDRIYSYLITTIDDDFSFTINNQDGYHKLFSDGEKYKSYYHFLEKVNAHEYILDLGALIESAYDRNSTFLEILKNQKDD